LRLLIRDSNVVDGTPRRAAAPFAPETRPPAAARASSICRRSWLRKVTGNEASGGAAAAPAASCSSMRSVSPSERITARSMTFWSSRTFPGHG